MVGAVIALGAIGGVVLGLVSALWGRTPAGNAALAVPFAGGPAALAAGWAVLALALWQGMHGRRLLAAAVLEGAAALILALGVVFAPAIGFVSRSGAGGSLSLLVLAVPLLLAVLVGAALATWLCLAPRGRAWALGAAAAALAIAAVLLPTGLGYVLAPLLLPLPLVAPLLASTKSAQRGRRNPGWLVGGAVVLPIALVAGFAAGTAFVR